MKKDSRPLSDPFSYQVSCKGGAFIMYYYVIVHAQSLEPMRAGLCLAVCAFTACSSYGHTAVLTPMEGHVPSGMTLALLPLDNRSGANHDAVTFLQKRFAEHLRLLGHRVIPIEDVNTLLGTNDGPSVSDGLDGGHLAICTVIRTDGLVYGALENFSFDTGLSLSGRWLLGGSTTREVRLKAKLLRCPDGRLLWTNGLGIRRVSGWYLRGVFDFAWNLLTIDTADKTPPLSGTYIPAPWIAATFQGDGADIGISLIEHLNQQTRNEPLATEVDLMLGLLLRGTCRMNVPGVSLIIPSGVTERCHLGTRGSL